MMARKEAGQSLAELAMLLPLLLLILLGCLDLGRAFSVWMTLNNATREGARYACLYPNQNLTIIERTHQDILAEGLSVSGADLYVGVDTPWGIGGGNPIKVTAHYTLPMMTSYLFGGKPLRIAASTQMAILGGN